MKNNDNKTKLHKAVRGTGIAIKVVLVLCGMAVLAFFAWLGFQFYTWLGV